MYNDSDCKANPLGLSSIGCCHNGDFVTAWDAKAFYSAVPKPFSILKLLPALVYLVGSCDHIVLAGLVVSFMAEPIVFGSFTQIRQRLMA